MKRGASGLHCPHMNCQALTVIQLKSYIRPNSHDLSRMHGYNSCNFMAHPHSQWIPLIGCPLSLVGVTFQAVPPLSRA